MTSIRIIRDHQELLSFESQWRELYAVSGSDNVFLTFDWADAWCRHFIHDGDLRVLAAERDGATVCIAPLFRTAIRGSTKLRFLGAPLADYGGFLFAPGHSDALADCLSYVDRQPDWDWLDLRGILQDSPSFDILAASYHGPEWTALMFPYEVAPYLPIVSSWDKYWLGLQRKLRNDTGRRIRRLEEIGKLHFKPCEGLENAMQTLDQFASQKGARYRATGGRDIFGDPRVLPFLKEITRSFWERGWIRLPTLCLDDEVLGIQFGFVFANKYFYYMASFNTQYASYAAGRVLLYYLLENSFREGLREFDFMSGGEPYKYDWVSNSRKLYALRAYRRSIRGLAQYAFNERLVARARESERLRALVRWKRKIRQ